jgi:hypothetical protein
LVVTFQVRYSQAMRFDRTEPSPHVTHQPENSGSPKSAAWLVAEGAFAPPRRPPPPLAADVTIRRSRLALITQAQGRQVDSAPQVQKGPRVFRIDLAREAAPAGVAPQAPSPVPEQQHFLRTVPRRQRIGVDKRPGPVLRVVTPPAEPVHDAAQDLQPASTPLQQAPGLVQLMAQLQSTFDDIAQARSFQFQV